MFFFSKYVNDNAEALRSKFVDHDGQKKLIIIEHAASVEESLLMEKNWDFFFQEIIKKINENTKDDIVSKLSNDFSTSDNFRVLASTSLIMNTMKKYFSYGRAICLCGINNVHFKGTLDDWINLSTKIDLLNEYDTGNNILTKYIASVKIILEKFVETYQGNVDLSFWNTIMSTEEERIGSGGDKNTHIEGWILHFYGIYTRTCFEDLQSQTSNVPIKLLNEYTNTVKDLELVTEFSGIVKIDENIYAPRLSLTLNVEKQCSREEDNYFDEH